MAVAVTPVNSLSRTAEVLAAQQSHNPAFTEALARSNNGSKAPGDPEKAEQDLVILLKNNDIPNAERLLADIKAGKVPGFNINFTDNVGRTALHYATLDGNEQIMKDLLKLGADPTIADQGNFTPYELATHYMSHKPQLAQI